jgi:dipeptidase E
LANGLFVAARRRKQFRRRTVTLRLALYSDQEIPANAAVDARLLQLIGKPKPRIGYVASSPDPERYFFDRKRTYYKALDADLSVYLDATTLEFNNTLSDLMACDAIHLSGGDTYAFLRWIKRSGLHKMLCNFAMSGKVLVGTSAGAILMTPSICTAALCGDMPDRDPQIASLNLVPFHFWPHYVNGNENDEAASLLLNSLQVTYACPDGSGVIVDGPEVALVGAVRKFPGECDI